MCPASRARALPSLRDVTREKWQNKPPCNAAWVFPSPSAVCSLSLTAPGAFRQLWLLGRASPGHQQRTHTSTFYHSSHTGSQVAHTRVLALREKNPRGVQKCTKKSELLLPSSEQPFPSVINSNMQSTKMGPEYLFGSEFYC